MRSRDVVTACDLALRIVGGFESIPAPDRNKGVVVAIQLSRALKGGFGSFDG